MARKALNKRILICAGLMVLLALSASLRASVVQNKTKLRITVSGKKSDGSMSIAGADVLLRSTDGVFEANPSTDSKGVANVSQVPYGKVLIQVTAAGWKTFGQFYDLNRKEQTIPVELEPSPQPTPTPKPSETPSPE